MMTVPNIVISIFLFAQICLAHINTEYLLSIHHPNIFPNDGIAIAKIYPTFDTDSSINSFGVETMLSKTVDDTIDGGFCMSLLDERHNTLPQFTCFNFFSSSSFIKGNVVYGELAIGLSESRDSVTSVSFYPTTEHTLSAMVMKHVNILKPLSRLSLNARNNADESLSSEQIANNAEPKEEKQVKKEKTVNTQNPKVISDEEQENFEEFQEIVKPIGLYTKNQTFIEKYWMYIVPPMVIIFIFGNLGGENMQ